MSVQKVVKLAGAGLGQGASLTKLKLTVWLPLGGMEVMEDENGWKFRKARKMKEVKESGQAWHLTSLSPPGQEMVADLIHSLTTLVNDNPDMVLLQ